MTGRNAPTTAGPASGERSTRAPSSSISRQLARRLRSVTVARARSTRSTREAAAQPARAYRSTIARTTRARFVVGDGRTLDAEGLDAVGATDASIRPPIVAVQRSTVGAGLQAASTGAA